MRTLECSSEVNGLMYTLQTTIQILEDWRQQHLTCLLMNTLLVNLLISYDMTSPYVELIWYGGFCQDFPLPFWVRSKVISHKTLRKQYILGNFFALFSSIIYMWSLVWVSACPKRRSGRSRSHCVRRHRGARGSSGTSLLPTERGADHSRPMPAAAPRRSRLCATSEAR